MTRPPEIIAPNKRHVELWVTITPSGGQTQNRDTIRGLRHIKRYRHGDVLLKGIRRLPEGVSEEEVMPLAVGEATGYAHRFTDGEVRFWRKNDVRYVQVLTPATLCSRRARCLDDPARAV